MKTILPLIALCILVGFTAPQAAAQQPDLIAGDQNASFSYNDNTKILSNLFFFLDNQGAYCYDSFNVVLHFVDANSGQEYRIGHRRRPGLADNANLVTNRFSISPSFDLNNPAESIPSGMYKLRVTVDGDGEIEETNENNNQAFLTFDGSEIQYTAPGSTAIAPDVLSGVSFGPNPVVGGQFSLMGLTQAANVQISSLDGREVLLLQSIQNNQAVLLPSGLPTGLYLLNIEVDGSRAVRKLLVY